MNARYPKSVAEVNAVAQRYGLTLQKGEGYFYWDHPDVVTVPSIYVAHYNHMQPSKWGYELNCAIEHVRGEMENRS